MEVLVGIRGGAGQVTSPGRRRGLRAELFRGGGRCARTGKSRDRAAASLARCPGAAAADVEGATAACTALCALPVSSGPTHGGPPFAPGAGATGSIRGDARRADHLGPAQALLPDEPAEGLAVAVVHGSGTWTQLPQPRLGSSGADIVRAPELQHAVERMDGDVHLGRPTLVRARAQPVADHPLEAGDIGLDCVSAPNRGSSRSEE